MASEALDRALHYLTRSPHPDAAALRALGEAELRELRAMLRDGRVAFPPTVVRGLEALIVERRARRRMAGRADDGPSPLARGTVRATVRLSMSVLALVASMVGFAVLLVRMNRWP